MILSFEITMPNVGSWNGVWTGSKNPHFAFRKIPDKIAKTILKDSEYRNYYYNFGDGWGANVQVKKILSTDRIKLEKINKGFMNYDWMVDSILKHDKIIWE